MTDFSWLMSLPSPWDVLGTFGLMFIGVAVVMLLFALVRVFVFWLQFVCHAIALAVVGAVSWFVYRVVKLLR